MEQSSKGLGLFIRGFVGLDREAVKKVLSSFMQDWILNSYLFELMETVINHLTKHGLVEPEILYGSPYSDLHFVGSDGLFPQEQDVKQFIVFLREVTSRALMSE